MAGSDRARALSDALRATKPFVTRFLAGFDDDNRTSQAPGMPNHAAWSMGHLALTMHRFAERFDGNTLPDSDFITGDGASGDSERFDTESVCFGSNPVDDPAIYPALAKSRRVFEDAIDRLTSALEGLDDAKLDEIQPWGSGEFPVAELAARIIFHNGTHAGQLTDLRRALGMSGVIG